MSTGLKSSEMGVLGGFRGQGLKCTKGLKQRATSFLVLLWYRVPENGSQNDLTGWWISLCFAIYGV